MIFDRGRHKKELQARYVLGVARSLALTLRRFRMPSRSRRRRQPASSAAPSRAGRGKSCHRSAGTRIGAALAKSIACVRGFDRMLGR